MKKAKNVATEVTIVNTNRKRFNQLGTCGGPVNDPKDESCPVGMIAKREEADVNWNGYMFTNQSCEADDADLE